MRIFLNELSFCGQAIDETEAGQLIHSLLQVLKELDPLRRGDNLVRSQLLWQRQLLPGRCLHDCLVGRAASGVGPAVVIDELERKLFIQLVQAGPFTESILDESDNIFECALHPDGTDVSFTSIAAAAASDEILASLQNVRPYNLDLVQLMCIPDTGDPFQKSVSNFFSSEEAGRFVTRWFASQEEWKTTLWERKQQLFPQLLFSDDVRKQIDRFQFCLTTQNVIMDHLSKMNEYVELCRSDSKLTPRWDQMGMEASPETNETMTKYGHLREFICPHDNKKRIFSWHSKLKTANVRIHFYPPDGEVDYFIVGYIGPKLKTVKYRH